MELRPDLSLGVSLSHIQRAPSYEELFAYGHHHATETIEQGDRGLSEERSNSLDLTLNWVGENKNITLSPYYTRFNSYIAMINSGQTLRKSKKSKWWGFTKNTTGYTGSNYFRRLG